MLKFNLQLFGGRGSEFGGDNRPLGGGGAGDNFAPFGVGEKIPETLAEALGKQGKPYTMDNTLKNVNPNFSPFYSEYSENCQRCAPTYEARRRGYDVTALPTYKGDTMPYGYGYAQVFKNPKIENVGATTSKKAQANLEAKMKAYGSGSRGIVGIPNHVFNVENVGGKIRYIDGQTGQKYTSNDVFGRIGKKGLKTITLLRTDNLEFSDYAKNAFITKK